MKFKTIICLTVLAVSVVTNVLGGPEAAAPSDEAKKLASKMKEFEKLMTDFQDVIQMGELKPAKNLCFKLSQYEGLSKKVFALAERIEKSQSENQNLETELGKCKSDLENLQTQSQGFQTQLQDIQLKLSEADSNLANCQSQLTSSQGSESSFRLQLQDLKMRLDRSQSDLAASKLSLKACQDKSQSSSVSSHQNQVSQ